MSLNVLQLSKRSIDDPGLPSTSFLILCSAFVFLMVPGLGLFYSGLSNYKNALSNIMIVMLVYCVVAIQWLMFGFSLSFSETGSPFIGNFDYAGLNSIEITPLELTAPQVPGIAFSLYQLQFAGITVAIIFGVVIGKEIFGGTGMNILNPALTIRAFLFFAYPTWMSGDKVWVTGAVERTNEIAAGANLDAISGETILGGLAQGNELAYSVSDMFFGFIPGSVGETSTLLILLAGLYLIYTKVASWRIIVSSVIGALIMGLIFNGVVDAGWITESSKFYTLMSTAYWQHLLIGGLAFGIVFMATDPVTASQTNKGKWIYGFLIGFISVMIRVFNPAYPEGVMLAILLMNVFAPTIDHYVVQGNVKRRLKRLKSKTA